MADNESTEVKQVVDEKQKRSPLRKFAWWYKNNKKLSIPLTILLLLVVCLAVPTSRYATLGLFWRENLVVTVKDSQNQQPVSQATVEVAGKTALTDNEGQVKLERIPVGYQSLKVTKANYKTSETPVELALFANNKEVTVSFEATGRPLEVTVTDRVSEQPVVNALVDAGNQITATSDDKGLATLVIPANVSSVELSVSSKNFNKTTVKAQPEKPANVQLMPAGKVFFLSKKSGKIDVVRTNLDGTDRKTIIKGTGKERDNETSLLASRDWRYLALLSKRTDDGSGALYLIDTKTNSLTQIDGKSDTDITLIGWAGHQFWYKVDREGDYWASNKEALKTVNADTKQIQVVDQDKSVGNESNAVYQTLDNFYIQQQGLIYTRTWSTALSLDEYYGSERKLLSGKSQEIVLASTDGTLSGLKTYPLKSVSYMTAKLYEPRELYFQITNRDSDKSSYIEYEDGEIMDASVSEDEFYKSYPTFLVSPSDKKTFWGESRDGKNALFVGDEAGKNKTQLASSSEYTAYGWLTDTYLLLQKNNSELYVSTVDRMKKDKAPIKISDYHKPSLNYAGYGYGYGGL